ncbi:Outer membrane lipoprotein-sorting protein [Chitinophaga costaii]|uniref:Outer membrane lipoprotein-sorting protein n=1 Tax=Chitinophaga costaii TaxID=1335309 RepID=A0A1C3ZGZ4_9BACT|nr:outer membrane lipoprotein carrier protein LolA [Chitinophaga costaii]PUZ30369.1 outer membrane lipoprotein carrier protein LolA [Chitinophaga costaii]SCB81621.1 Outer membrane lipoprotein-sorting protein [Chitinophaga costaii]
MRKYWMIIFCCFTAGSALAQAGYKPLGEAAAVAFSQQLIVTARNTESIQSDFVQVKTLSMLSDKIVSKGKFWFKKENKVRMEYTTPSYYLLVMNGKDIKTKDSQQENKVSGKTNKLFEQVNRITVDCVQGTVLSNTDFSNRMLENGSMYLLELTPVSKGMKDLFVNISVFIDKKEGGVNKIVMQEYSGDNTVITFVHKQLNVNIPDALFAIK